MFLFDGATKFYTHGENCSKLKLLPWGPWEGIVLAAPARANYVIRILNVDNDSPRKVITHNYLWLVLQTSPEMLAYLTFFSVALLQIVSTAEQQEPNFGLLVSVIKFFEILRPNFSWAEPNTLN